MRDFRLQLGKIAGAWFFACLILFASLRADYSHWTKAVSELGAFGAPNALLWNTLGFFATGALLVGFGLGLRRLLRERQVHSTGPLSVIALGVTFAATAIPADFYLRFESGWTIAHAVFVLLGPVAFIWGACVWPRALARLGASRRATAVCALAGLLMIPAFGSNAVLEPTPGVAQRLGFAVMFLWCWVLSAAVGRVDQPTAET